MQSASNFEYLEQLKKLAAMDSRISILPAVPVEQVVALLQSYHLLAVPSRWFEVSPIVMHQAFAAGTPLIGSNLGGIIEMIEHEVNGMLVDPDSVEGWSHVIRRCYEDQDLLERLRRGVRPSREMSEAAQEILLSVREGHQSIVRKILFIQYTNPAIYPPLEHSSRILANRGWQVLFLGTGSLGADSLRFKPHERIEVKQMPFCPAGWRQKLHYARFVLWALWWTLRWKPEWTYASDLLSCPAAALSSYLPGIASDLP